MQGWAIRRTRAASCFVCVVCPGAYSSSSIWAHAWCCDGAPTAARTLRYEGHGVDWASPTLATWWDFAPRQRPTGPPHATGVASHAREVGATTHSQRRAKRGIEGWAWARSWLSLFGHSMSTIPETREPSMVPWLWGVFVWAIKPGFKVFNNGGHLPIQVCINQGMGCFQGGNVPSHEKLWIQAWNVGSRT